MESPKSSESVTVRVVGLAGSLRPESATRMAVRYALKGAEQAGAKTRLLDIASYDLPFYGRNMDGKAKAVESFRSDLRAANGMLIGSPEYHGSMSGVLKNALDLATSDEFEGKMVGLIGLAGGQMGATNTLNHLQTVGRNLHAWVVPTQVSIANSSDAFDAQGEPTRPELGNRLRAVGKQVAHFALLHECENHLQFLKEWEGAPADEAMDVAPPAR